MQLQQEMVKMEEYFNLHRLSHVHSLNYSYSPYLEYEVTLPLTSDYLFLSSVFQLQNQICENLLAVKNRVGVLLFEYVPDTYTLRENKEVDTEPEHFYTLYSVYRC